MHNVLWSIMYALFFYMHYIGLSFTTSNAYGHTTLNAPVLVRSPKLSSVGPAQYLDGWPPGNSRCCRLFLIFFSFRLLMLIWIFPQCRYGWTFIQVLCVWVYNTIDWCMIVIIAASVPTVCVCVCVCVCVECVYACIEYNMQILWDSWYYGTSILTKVEVSGLAVIILYLIRTIACRIEFAILPTLFWYGILFSLLKECSKTRYSGFFGVSTLQICLFGTNYLFFFCRMSVWLRHQF